MTTENQHEVKSTPLTETANVSDSFETASSPATQEMTTDNSGEYLPHATVNELIRKQKNKAYQKGVDEASSQWQSELQKIREEMASLKSSNPSTPQAAQREQYGSSDNVRSLVNEELQRYQAAEQEKQQQAQVEGYIKQTMEQLAPKVQEAAARYADFDDVTQAADFINEAPELLFYANGVDNGGDVLYNLAKNPSKIGALKSLSPKLAQLEMKKLSESLKQNDSAKHAGSPRAPLSQTRPSNIGGDNGPPSLRDLKAKYARMV